ncbi:MAG: NAD(P)-dependent oxidoreductase [Rhodospirillaceae bacterium]|nr:NAD(P)-dependent oxidoreductase [Rhodospirillaceae bacterium]MBT5911603.1 NAD(P)-dependent oxidoreductase [Rhodospirillaceae bacterium]MBT6306762.1 NAD(P)-dependent oxidoreductase [Rhodospirillaceae bacterium]MDC0998826.1 NAD(P)-dependent oxidoreductase [Alphaproteobacteria bacterium]MDC1172289.1 NAD(P)-dependent oxidoreductase [Alphaproteobacteria bacterium]
MNSVIGYLGLGNMGQPMASRLMDAGNNISVFDIDETAMKPLAERQALQASSPRDLADKSEIVICSLPSNSVIREAVLGNGGLIEGEKIRIYVSACTTGSTFAEEITEALAEKGIATLEAPISGGPPGARAGTLSVMVSGPQDAYEELIPYFKAYGKKLVYCGEKPGLAQVLKLANNILFATSLAVTSEALAMGVKAGIDPNVMLEAIQAGTGRNAATDLVIPTSVLPRSFDFGASIEILLKDVNLALEEGEKQGVPQFVCQQTRQMLLLAAHKGWNQRDVSEWFKLVEEWAGIEIRSSDK